MPNFSLTGMTAFGVAGATKSLRRRRNRNENLPCAYREGWVNRFGAEQAVPLATHGRDICFVKNSYWIISDRLEAGGEHTYSQLFHFDPDRTVKAFGPGRAGTDDAGRANVVLVQADTLPAQVIKGREDPPQGWCAPGHGKLSPAPMLSFDQKAMNHAVYDTVVLPLDVGMAADITVDRLAVVDEQRTEVAVADVCALRITTPRGVDYYLNGLRQREIGPANGRIKRAGPLMTDARASVVRLDAAGKVLCASIVGGEVLRLDGVEVKAARREQQHHLERSQVQ